MAQGCLRTLGSGWGGRPKALGPPPNPDSFAKKNVCNAFSAVLSFQCFDPPFWQTGQTTVGGHFGGPGGMGLLTVWGSVFFVFEQKREREIPEGIDWITPGRSGPINKQQILLNEFMK